MALNDLTISWPQVIKFIGQLTHDIRNHLNAVELQAAFVGEIAESAEVKSEVMRLREMTGAMSEQLQRISMQLSKIHPTTMRYPGSDLVEDLRDRVGRTQAEKAARIEWESELGDAALETDPELLLSAFAELIENARTHQPGDGPLVFRARTADATLVFELREPKSAPVEVAPDWGAAPLAQLRHGHYALGLLRARSIFEAHHGIFQTHFDPAESVLITTVTLPRAQA